MKVYVAVKHDTLADIYFVMGVNITFDGAVDRFNRWDLRPFLWKEIEPGMAWELVKGNFTYTIEKVALGF
jgi:hypothetical protein